MNRSPVGTVYLVGAGPGDPGLITLRGIQCLRKADVVLYDYLVNPQVLEHAHPAARLVCLGRHGRGTLMPPSEIQRQMVESARRGQCVVRLKGGDPVIFARAAEEIDALLEAEIPFEIVPGITAALAAGSYAGIPLTHRDTASAVALVTGQRADGHPDALDYNALARFPGTLVFYMGVTTAATWSRRLIDAGRPADTPVAMLRRVSWPDQTVDRCRLDQVAAVVEQRRLRPPVIFIVGQVAAVPGMAAWFTRRPLVGRRVLVTRPADQGPALRDALQQLGAAVDVQPAIEIRPPEDWSAVDAELARLETYHWLVFSSVNGVRYFFDRLLSVGRDHRALGTVKLAAVGPATAEALLSRGLRVDVQPAEYRAEALAESLGPQARGKRFLLARASRGREVLAEQLRAAGGDVRQVVVYQSRDVPAPDPDIAAALSAGQYDWVTVTSSAIARSLAALFGPSLRRSRLASISPITSATLREVGYEPAVEADVYTMEGVVEAVLRDSTTVAASPPAP